MPSEIIDIIVDSEGGKPAVKGLADEVRTWFRALNYDVSEPIKSDERTIDLRASFNKGIQRHELVIRCIEGAIRLEDIRSLDESKDIETTDKWLITEMKIPRKVREESQKYERIEVYNLTEFLVQKVWGSYFDAISAMISRENISEFYVDIGCYEQSSLGQTSELNKVPYESLDDYIDDWLRARGKMHISLLGDFGSGKTWFCKHYTYRQMQRYMGDPVNQRLPLLITLRDFTKAVNSEQLINNIMHGQYRLPFFGNAFEVFQEMNRRGKLLLILDGFDEMARQVDYQVVVDNFWEIARLVDQNSKVILTCRTEYFRWAGDSEKILGGGEYGRSTIVLSPPKFEVIYIEKLSDIIIERIISIRKREKGSEIAVRILKNPNLLEMARKPVLIELLLAALDEVSPDVLEKQAQAYLYSTNKLLLRNIMAKRAFTSTTDKIFFLCELAWEMIQSGELKINYKEFPLHILDYFKDKVKNKTQLDHWDFDLRAQMLFHRDVNGYYSFAHKSMAEYFAAFKLCAELGCLSPPFTETYKEENGKLSPIPYAQRNLRDLAKTFGKLSIMRTDMNTVRTFLLEMLNAESAARLWSIIDEASGDSSIDLGHCVGNAATLLNDLGLWRPPMFEEINDLLESMQMQSETVFPPRPATLAKVEKEIKKLAIFVPKDQGDIDKLYSIDLHKKVGQAYILAGSNRLSEASDLSRQITLEDSQFNFLNLSMQAYAALQSMFFNKPQDAKDYLNKYLDAGGNALWYHLKMGLVFLQEGLINESRLEAIDVLRDIENLECSRLTTTKFGLMELDYESCKKEVNILKGRAILLIGILERIETNYQESIDICDKARRIFVEFEDQYHVGIATANIGMALRMNRNFRDAIDQYDLAFETFKAENDNYRMACVQARRGTANRFMKNYLQALNDYKESIKKFEEENDYLRKGIVTRELGTTYLLMGALAEALENYKNAFAIFDSIDKSLHPEALVRIGFAYYSLGLVYLMQGEWSQSIPYLDKALENFRYMGDNYNISLTLSSLGSAYRMSDLPEMALNYLPEALSIARFMKDKRRESLILIKLGGAYRQKHDYASALNCYQESHKIILDIKGSLLLESDKYKNIELSEGKILGEMGAIYRRQNKIAEAIPYYEQAIDIFKKHHNQNKIGWILEEFGQIYVLQGFLTKAINEYEKALESIQNECGSSEDDSLSSLGHMCVFNIYKEGSYSFREALTTIERKGHLDLQAKILRNLGEAYRREGRFDEALERLKESQNIVKSVGDRDQLGKNLCYIGIVHSTLAYSNVIQMDMAVVRWIHYELAILSLNEAIEIFEKIDDKFLLGWALETLGKIYIMQQLWEDAKKAFESAMGLGYKNGIVYLSLAICSQNLNNEAELANHLSEARKLLNTKGINEYDVALLEANFGDINSAFSFLKMALEKKQTNITLMERDPFLAPITADLRFDILRQEFSGYKNTIIVPFM